MPVLRHYVLATLPLALAACSTMENRSGEAPAPGAATAAATLRGPDGSPRGTVQASQVDGGVRLVINGENLTPGTHGAHVHMTGSCNPPDFASAGGHWNPTGKQHGRNNPQGMHMGDLPNLLIGTDGRGSLEITVPGATINGGSQPMLDADGAAMVIHAGPDDLMTDPSGNSGGRIACGVFALN